MDNNSSLQTTWFEHFYFHLYSKRTTTGYNPGLPVVTRYIYNIAGYIELSYEIIIKLYVVFVSLFSRLGGGGEGKLAVLQQQQ